MSTRLPECHDRGPRRGALPLNLVPILVRAHSSFERGCVGGQVLVSSRVQHDMSVEPVDRSVIGPTPLRPNVVLEPIARTVDGDPLAVVKEAVQDRRGQDLVAEDLTPLPHSLKALLEMTMIEPCS